jgi:hypothetical protein
MANGKKAKRRGNADPIEARLDRVIELLEDLVMLTGKRFGLGRDEIRSMVSLDAKRVSKVTQNVNVTP